MPILPRGIRLRRGNDANLSRIRRRRSCGMGCLLSITFELGEKSCKKIYYQMIDNFKSYNTIHINTPIIPHSLNPNYFFYFQFASIG